MENSMSKKIYVKNLNWNTNESALEEAYSQFGTVTDTRIIKDRDSGRSRGFGFVTFENSNDADLAIRELNGVELDGRTVGVELAIDRQNTNHQRINS